jgi:Beta-propeller repeat
LGFKVGGSDSFLRKYNASGAVQWTRQFGTLGGDYVLDVALDAGGSIFALSQDDATGFVLRKFGPTGTLLASKIVPSATLPGLIPKALAIDGSGNVIVLAAWYDSGTSGNNVRVFKFTNALVSVWSVPYQTNFYDAAYDIATFGTDIYITARINTPTAGFGARYVKLNSAGTIVLTRQLEPTSTCNCTNPNSITVDSSGNIYVVADVYAASFSGFTNAGGADIVAFKYDSAGTRLWVRQLGAGTNGTALGDYTKAVAVSDAVYVTGNTFGNLLGDPKYGTTDTDAYLVQLDKTTGQIIGIDQ